MSRSMLAAATVTGLFAVWAAAGMARAQDFYAKQPTIGCFSIAAARRLTDPHESRIADPVWLASAMHDGFCRQIGHDQDWRLVTQVGDVSLMRHDMAGGDPVFLFFRSSALSDWHGQSPGNQALPPPTPKSDLLTVGKESPAPSRPAPHVNGFSGAR